MKEILSNLEKCPLCGGPNPYYHQPPSLQSSFNPPFPTNQTPVLPPPEVPAAVQNQSLQHPVLGGKITCFVLCYGDYLHLAQRCLDSILQTAPSDVLDLRVAANECSEPTLNYLRSLPLRKLYIFSENRKKYPVMRDIFRDPECPIETNYVVWFDDDSYVSNPLWLEKLADVIVANHNYGGRLYGWLHLHDLKMYQKNGHDPKKWFLEASWWKGKHFRLRGTRVEHPAGTVIEFIPGSFWALHTQTIFDADIPDVRLVHNGGDCTIGEQVHQAGGKLVSFNRNNQYVFTSRWPRRGYSEKFPWANPG